MAYCIVRNSLNPYKAIKVNVTLQQQVLKDGFDGEHIWIAELNTVEPSINGTKMPSQFIHLRTLDNLDAEIEKAINAICEQVDWSPAIADLRPPYVASYSPIEQVNVSIDSKLQIKLKESLPSAGIDISSIKVMLDDFDITNEVTITGDPYEYDLEWKPSIIVRDTYE